MVTCRTYTIEKAPTPGFTLTADQYEGIGSFNTTLYISYPTGAGQLVRIVHSDPDPEIGDSCLTTDIPLDGNGGAIVPYSVADTHTIYVIKKVGTGGEICCTSFSQTNCQYSNYITFTVTPPPDLGNIQFLSNPSGAQIWLAPVGQIPTDTIKVTSDTISNLVVGDYDYILKLANYNDYISTTPIRVIKDQTAIVGPINLVPAEGCIYFNSNPQNAEIWLAPVGQIPVYTGLTTPNMICGQSLGDYTYKLTLSGYEDITNTTSLITGHGEIVTNTLIELPVLTDIIISPPSPSVAVGTDQSFSATPIDQYGDPFPAIVTWSNSNSFVGNIDYSTGMFMALHIGTTIVTAASGSVSRSTIVTVTQLVPVLTTIIVSPITVTVVTNNATIFTATTLDQFGNPISATILWSSSDTNIGMISQNGVFTAISPGTTTIMATSGSVSGVAVANVTPAIPTEQPVLTKIVITPLTENLLVGAGTVFVASTLDQFGDSIIAPVIWDSSNTNVGTIDQYGIFSALHTGKTIITATSGTIVGVALVNVVATLPGQAGGLLGNINTAALIVGMAMVGTVVLSKPAQEIIVQGEEGIRAKLKRMQEKK